MTYTTVDSLVKGWLLKKQYPMHWYLQGLVYAVECIGILRGRTMKVIKTEVVTVASDGRITLDCAVEQVVRIGVAVGDKIKPLVRSKGTFNRMANSVATGGTGPYADALNYGFISSWYNSLFNDLGEFSGGLYGFGAGSESDIFEEFPEWNQIQVSVSHAGSQLFLDYVPGMESTDSLTRVPSNSVKCIQQYMTWHLKENGRHYSKGEAKDEERMYYREEELLRALNNPITAEDIMRAGDRSYHRSRKH